MGRLYFKRPLILLLPIGSYTLSLNLGLRKNIDIPQQAARAIIIYTVRARKVPEPPKSHATTSKPKIPTSPQFKPPITNKISAVISTKIPPFCEFKIIIVSPLFNMNSIFL